MVHYLHAVAAHNEARPLQNGPLLTGWCSWYHYYENISEENLRANFSKLTAMKSKVPTNVSVVDDGYMTAWGDWDSLKPKKFTSMANVARDVASAKMRPGLWLAPFAADKHSNVAKLHPEWIIRNDRGAPANSSNCGKFFYGLDVTNPQVRMHAFQAIRRAVREWGFQVLKIDFLYAACLEGNGKYDMSMTRAEAMHLALQTIREAAGPDVFLIGCGCPIGTGIGYVDGMRVSADTGPTWYPALPLPWWDNGTLPSLRAMIRNSLSRAPMGHRWWNNDPDCLLLGESTSLTNEEVASAASIIAMTCGMMLLSDDLTRVSLSRMKILTQICPMTGVSGVVLDLHTTKNKGMPSLIRLWCTDRYRHLEEFRATPSFRQSMEEEDLNAEATHFGRQSAYNPETYLAARERFRSCIHVAKGMGTWTVISLSNWADKAQMMHIPSLAISSPSETGWGAWEADPSSRSLDDGASGAGYHVYSFWSGRYSWLSTKAKSGDASKPYPITRRLLAHETEIFHIRKVTPGKPQYVGSDLHFSCGHEVLSFDDSEKNRVAIALKTELSRVGHLFLFIPIVDTSHVQVSVAGSPSRWSVIGNVPDEDGSPHCCGRIIRVMVVVHGDRSERDGEVVVDY
jgi:Melibiase